MNDKSLTLKNTFCAAQVFLDEYYQKNPTENLGCLLSGMSFLEDMTTADPAFLKDWLDAFSYATKSSEDFIGGEWPKIYLNPMQGFLTLKKFLNDYYVRTSYPFDIQVILKDLKLQNGIAVYQTVWKLWLNSIKKIQTGETPCIKLIIKQD